MVPVGSTFQSLAFPAPLPVVDVPRSALDLAVLLGVRVETNFATCVDVLSALAVLAAEGDIVAADVGIQWLFNIGRYVNPPPHDPSHVEDLASIPILCADRMGAGGVLEMAAVALGKVLVLRDSGGVVSIEEAVRHEAYLHIADLLGLTVISPSRNADVYALAGVLLDLGCAVAPTVEQVVAAAAVAAADPSFFFSVGSGVSVISAAGKGVLSKVSWLWLWSLFVRLSLLDARNPLSRLP